MKLNQFFLTTGLLIAISLTLSCSGDDGKDGASCIANPKENAAGGYDVICDGEKIGELSNGKDADCIVEPKRSNPGVYDVICNDQKVGELKDGAPGAQGTPGLQGQQGEGCSVADDPSNSAYLKMTCGSGETKTEKTWPKAVCGTIAYDPAIMACNKSILSFSFTDARDSIKYKAVVIGEGATALTWMAENLRYKGGTSSASGSSSSSPLIGKCYAEGVEGVSADSIAKNCAKYGRLYDWATAMGIDTLFNSNLYPGSAIIKVKGLCPAGWHLPDNNYEWQSLMILIGGKKTDGTKLKATSGWKDYGQYMPGCIWIGEDNRSCNIQVSGNGTDDYGFSALPGGMGYYSDYYRSYNYNSIEEYGYWWTSTGYSGDAQSAHYWDINYSNIYDNIYGSSSDKRQLFSIRCVKD